MLASATTLNIGYKGFRIWVEYWKTLKILKILSTGDPYNTLNFWPRLVDRGRCSHHSKPQKNMQVCLFFVLIIRYFMVYFMINNFTYP